MALSKPQQRVVNRMKKGWVLRLSTGPEAFAWLVAQSEINNLEKVDRRTLMALWHKGAIRQVREGMWPTGEYVLGHEPAAP